MSAAAVRLGIESDGRGIFKDGRNGMPYVRARLSCVPPCSLDSAATVPTLWNNILSDACSPSGSSVRGPLLTSSTSSSESDRVLSLSVPEVASSSSSYARVLGRISVPTPVKVARQPHL
jgi:hypothetical protein